MNKKQNEPKPLPLLISPVSRQWRCVQDGKPRTGWQHMELDGHNVWKCHADRKDNTAVIEYRDLYAIPVDLAERQAASVASMIIDYVEGGIKGGTDWRNGLEDVINRRLRRIAALSTQEASDV